MYESVISACKALDEFRLPRAIGVLDRDRFLFANDSFLRATGLQPDEISFLRLSEIVKFESPSLEAEEMGRLTPIAVRSPDRNVAVGSHATFGRDQLVFLMIPLYGDINQDVEAGAAMGQERERQRIAEYVHHRLAPELMALAFSIESLRTI
jgi:PAS domain-containing protein